MCPSSYRYPRVPGVQMEAPPASAMEHSPFSTDCTAWCTATSDVQWPKTGDRPKAQPPHGVKHHYAPLAIIGNDELVDCRRPFDFRALERRVGELQAEVDNLKGRVGALERNQLILLILDGAIIVFLILALILLYT